MRRRRREKVPQYDQARVAQKHVELRQCNHAAKYEFKPDPKALGKILLGTANNNWATYTAVAGYGHAVYRQTYKDLLDAKILGKFGLDGINVITRLLSFAPSAYIKFCQDKKTRPTIPGITEALKNSVALPTGFMDLPLSNSKQAEATFRLTSFFGDYSLPDLRFEDTETGPQFLANEETFGALAENPIYDSSTPAYLQRCMARRLVQAQIWPGMVDLCAQTPRVFPQALGLTEAT